MAELIIQPLQMILTNLKKNCNNPNITLAVLYVDGNVNLFQYNEGKNVHVHKSIEYSYQNITLEKKNSSFLLTPNNIIRRK